MDYIQILGLVAAVLTTAANIPQALKIIRTKSTKSISTTTYSLLLAGFAIWITYGFLRNDLPIILANGISALVSITILFLKHTSKKVLEDLHDKVHSDSE